MIAGCVSQVGEQAVNVGRNAALAAGFPESVPGTTIDRQCGSSQQAIHFAAQGVISGAYDAVIACGVEAMTRVPLGASIENGPGQPYGPRMLSRYNGALVHQGISAELIAQKMEPHARAAGCAQPGKPPPRRARPRRRPLRQPDRAGAGT